jgi:3-hydroxyacyl-[acyl-carrier-protein] dehydratase
VLAKFSKIAFHGLVRPGETITYQATVDQAKDAGASVTVTAHVGDRPQAEAEIFFARLAADSPDLPQGTRLFDPQHLLHWLKLVGVFEIGTRPDGTRLRIEDYKFNS